jgi:hypothetical protein
MEHSAFTINEFCARNKLSRSKFYQIRRKGLGPREMEIDGLRRITAEAEAAWKKANEAATQQTAA